MNAIFEDDDIFIINKPIGLTVNRSETTKEVNTLFDQIEQTATWSLVTDNLEFNNRCGVVHRLDKGTSGLLIIAKNPDSFVNLQSQFKAREVKKEYLALVHGVFDEGEATFTVDAPIGRNPKNRFRNAVVASGRSAVTKFEIVKLSTNTLGGSGDPTPTIRNRIGSERSERSTLVHAYPQTGRTHQIRVHLTALNHPICGDQLYCPQNLYKEYSLLLEDSHIEPRMFLHAASITFCHPATLSQMNLSAPLPPDLTSVLQLLGYGRI